MTYGNIQRDDGWGGGGGGGGGGEEEGRGRGGAESVQSSEMITHIRMYITVLS